MRGHDDVDGGSNVDDEVDGGEDDEGDSVFIDGVNDDGSDDIFTSSDVFIDEDDEGVREYDDPISIRAFLSDSLLIKFKKIKETKRSYFFSKFQCKFIYSISSSNDLIYGDIIGSETDVEEDIADEDDKEG